MPKKKIPPVVIAALVEATVLIGIALGCSVLRKSHAVEKPEISDTPAVAAKETPVPEKIPASEEAQDPEAEEETLPTGGFRTVGSIVTLGSYEQDNDPENGREAIEWAVLDVQDGRSLIISKFALDCQPYNTDIMPDPTWETCSLRKWMNEDFLREAFSAEEQKRISGNTVTADRNPEYDTDPGRDTEDLVFLLSMPEAERYFNSDAAGQCIASPYALAKACYADPRDGSCCWWLRSPGFSAAFAAFVDSYGVIKYGGDAVASAPFGVRPALWITLED